MRYTRVVHVSAAAGLFAALTWLSPVGGRAMLQETPVSTAFVPHCALAATPASGTAATEEATQLALTAAVTTTAAAPAATNEVNTALQFIDLEPFDVRFNPNRDKPFVVIMSFTLFFKNQLNETLDVRTPRFQLSIDQVAWGDLASTDFQMGKLQANARQGIVLQSLMVMNKATDPQKAVLECVKAKAPVDLVLTGTIDVYPDGTKQTLTVDLVTKQVVLPSSN